MVVILDFMNLSGGLVTRKTVTVNDLNEAIHGGTQWITGRAPATGDPWPGGVLPASFAVREADAQEIAGSILYDSRSAS
jgi:hypothetical protein